MFRVSDDISKAAETPLHGKRWRLAERDVAAAELVSKDFPDS